MRQQARGFGRDERPATFWFDGTYAEPGYWSPLREPRWPLMAGWKRASILLLVLTVLGSVGWGLLFHRAGTELVLAAVTGATAGLGITQARWTVRDWKHNRDWVNPLNEALPPEVTVRELARDRTKAILALPVGFAGEEKDRQIILTAAAAKLNPPGALEPAWSLHGKKPQVTLTLIPPPPGYVTFADVQPYADAAEEHQIIPGLTRPDRKYPKGAPVIISIGGDSPHLGFSISSGGGKSVAARNAACQLAHHGTLIACVDPKLMSQHWAAGLRNVAYARTAEEMHELAIWLYGEVQRRNQVVLYSADVEGRVHAKVGPRIACFLEELGATQAELAAYWKEIGGKGRSPAVIALDKVAFTGRAVDVNLFYIAQRLSAKAVSGGSNRDASENLGVLFMRNASKRTWDMLVGDRHAQPPATDVDGRIQIVMPKEVIEVQGAFVTGAQAREYATSGIVAVPRDDMPCVGGLAPVGTPERASQDVTDMDAIEGNGPDLHVVPDIVPNLPVAPPRITIPDAIAEEISGPTYDAVRKALARDRRDGKPVPVPLGRRGNADEYDRIEWCDWEEARRQPRRLVR